jgi:hypothetical protein
MDIGKSLTFIADDEKWYSKLLLGALISVVPILNFAWVGYLTDLMHNVSQNLELPLPNWDDLGEKFITGLKISAAAMIYSLPILLLGIIPLSAIFISNLNTGQDAGDALVGVVGGAGMLAICCVSLYGLLLSFVFPAVHLYFARHGTFQSCFHVKEISQLIALNSANYLVAWLISILAGVVLGTISGILSVVIGIIPCIGWIIAIVIPAFVTVWVSVIYAHLFGQIGTELSFTEQLELDI